MGDVPSQLADALRDRYTLERELGRGGMATVYLARDLKHHRQVALKVLRPELAAMVGLIDAAPLAILALDLQGCVRNWNQAAETPPRMFAR